MNEFMIGHRIREERLRLNLTQEKLAEDVDLTTAYIGQVERGERNLTLENLIQLSQILAGRPQNEKELAVSLIKTLFDHLDRNKEDIG